MSWYGPCFCLLSRLTRVNRAPGETRRNALGSYFANPKQGVEDVEVFTLLPLLFLESIGAVVDIYWVGRSMPCD